MGFLEEIESPRVRRPSGPTSIEAALKGILDKLPYTKMDIERGSLINNTSEITSLGPSMIDDPTLVSSVESGERSLFDLVKEMEEQFTLMMDDVDEIKHLERIKRKL
jgi:hypothetical protein